VIQVLECAEREHDRLVAAGKFLRSLFRHELNLRLHVVLDVGGGCGCGGGSGVLGSGRRTVVALLFPQLPPLFFWRRRLLLVITFVFVERVVVALEKPHPAERAEHGQ
jgi:hypothetical protein